MHGRTPRKGNQQLLKIAKEIYSGEIDVQSGHEQMFKFLYKDKPSFSRSLRNANTLSERVYDMRLIINITVERNCTIHIVQL